MKLFEAILQADFSDFQFVTRKVNEQAGNYDERLFLLLSKDGDPRFLQLPRAKASVIFQNL